MCDSQVFQWAGVGFGEQETYRLQKSLKKLSETTAAQGLRFFGKIWGTKADYYVVEVTGDAAGEGDDDAAEGGDDGEEAGEGAEARGTGVNKYSYFVAPDALSAWTRLPDLSPADVKAAREVKVVFTGELNRPIYTNPFFFGQEKHYLRAQIARIVHSTTLLPRSLWMEDAENPREIAAQEPPEGEEEVEIPSTQQMAHPGMWVHALPNILLNCLTEHKDVEPPADLEEEFDQEAANAALASADPYEKRLKPISLDGQVNVAKKVK
jgi:radial spoke head protein 4A